MKLSLRLRRLTTGLALWLVLLASLMPLVGQALASSHDPVTEQQLLVCGSTGMHWVTPEAVSSDDNDPSSSVSLGGCAWCQLHADSWMPAGAVSSVPVFAAIPQAPHRHRPAALIASSWRQPQTRAPPSA
ncbi:MAG: hypothetical protein RIS48_1937 [Pseudomonadota bacterium]|jgi:hypothetical protein